MRRLLVVHGTLDSGGAPLPKGTAPASDLKEFRTAASTPLLPSEIRTRLNIKYDVRLQRDVAGVTSNPELLVPLSRECGTLCVRPGA
jgi:hypothetical protein